MLHSLHACGENRVIASSRQMISSRNTPPQSSSHPLISVVITAWNRAALLPRAVASLQAQTLHDWEAIIVDDGSTDDTRAVVDRLMKGEPRLLYLWQENAGLPMARNAGLAVARAPLLTFLDSDDEYRPQHLAERVNFFRRHPETDLLHGGLEIVGGVDWVPDRHDPSRRIPLSECYVGGTFVMRRSVFETLGGFRPPAYGDDYDFMCRALEAFRVAKVDVPSYVYHRDTPDGLCNLMAHQHRED